VHGARENNLKNVSVEIPKRRLTVFTGVSGSGKSSLVYATIAAESQRLINETYSAFVQGFMPSLSRPDVDLLEGLTTAIVVDQERMGANSRSTVGTATDANAMLRILFSRLGVPSAGPAFHYSFNEPAGWCPRCEGRGTVNEIDLDELFDRDKSLAQGAITVPGYTPDSWNGRIFCLSGILDADKPIRDYTEQEMHDFLYKEPVKVKVEGANLTYEGLVPKVQTSYLQKDKESLQPHIRAFVERAVTFTACPECGGGRLNAAARSSRVDGINIADACAMQISDLAEWVRGITAPSVAPLLATLGQTFDSFVEIGLGYLSLDRPSGTLSGGEAQRTRMIRHLGSSLIHLRRAHRGAASARHPADERTAAAVTGQGQHRAGRRAQAGDDRDRRPRGRPRTRRGRWGWHGVLRGYRRRPAG
jgi:excinuclease UvrABC ATPase subunit